MRALLLLLASCLFHVHGLVVSPAVRSSTVLRASAAALRMQVEAPVKIPDKVPNLAPAKPTGDKQNEKGKKHKVLLFNDNVNKCASLFALLRNTLRCF